MHHGLFIHSWMSFGVKNSLLTFKCARDVMRGLVKWENAIVYIDNPILFSNIVVVLLRHINEQLLLLNNAVATIHVN